MKSFGFMSCCGEDTGCCGIAGKNFPHWAHFNALGRLLAPHSEQNFGFSQTNSFLHTGHSRVIPKYSSGISGNSCLQWGQIVFMA